MSLDVNDAVTLRCRILNDAGDPVEPTTLVLTVTAPDGTVTTVAKAGLTLVSVGSYRHTVVLTAAGVWRYRFDSGGNVEQSEGGLVVVGAATTSIAPWCTLDDLELCAACAGKSLDDGVKARAIVAASEYLHARSGRRYPGYLLDTVRPCAQTQSAPWSVDWRHPTVPVGTCVCGVAPPHRSCGCPPLSEVRLPGVVQGIVEVVVDGVTLPSSAYRVRDRAYLVRLDGDAWPCCQDLSRDPSEPDTWEVTYARGVEPPELGRLAAAELACEITLAFAGSADCRLPRSVQSLSRQGVSVGFLPPLPGDEGAIAGLPLVGAFLRAEGTGGRRGGAHIASPDVSPIVSR